MIQNAGVIPGTHEPGFTEVPIQAMPVGLAAGPGQLYVAAYRMGQCSIMVGRERAATDRTYLWHLSIASQHRHPTWDEIKVARYRLLPLDKTFGMLLPPPRLYVNLAAQDHVFHLWEVTDPRAPWETL